MSRSEKIVLRYDYEVVRMPDGRLVEFEDDYAPNLDYFAAYYGRSWPARLEEIIGDTWR